ncbi:MAG: magnesium transporter [Candidatus Hadarchaeota archaeon]
MDWEKTTPIIHQGLPILVVCALIEFGAGSFLGSIEENLAGPGIIIMVPPLLDLRGNIGGAMASRLGTGLHGGIIDSEKIWNPEVTNNLGASSFLTLFTATAVGFMAFGVSVLTGISTFSLHLLGKLVSIAVIASLLSNIGLMFLTIFISIFSFRRGWDPDNVTAPIIATIGDFLTAIAIYLSVLLVI